MNHNISTPNLYRYRDRDRDRDRDREDITIPSSSLHHIKNRKPRHTFPNESQYYNVQARDRNELDNICHTPLRQKRRRKTYTVHLDTKPRQHIIVTEGTNTGVVITPFSIENTDSLEQEESPEYHYHHHDRHQYTTTKCHRKYTKIHPEKDRDRDKDTEDHTHMRSDENIRSFAKCIAIIATNILCFFGIISVAL